ncbi:MAG: T9SS type A sorting domain-containing protein [Bacteroidales bacterium]
MKKLLFLGILVCIGISLKAQVNGKIMADTNNLTIIKVWGTHYERGFAYGSLMGSEITDVFDNYVKPLFGSYYSTARNIMLQQDHLKVDSMYVNEAKAIIAGMDSAGTNTSNLDHLDILTGNSVLDVYKLLAGKSYDMGCSSLMSWGDATAGSNLNGKSAISRHLDWMPDPAINDNQVICVHLPAESDEQPWASIGFASMIGALSGFNAELGVFQHNMSDFNGSVAYGKQYEPVWFSLRKAIEKRDYNSDGENNVQDLKAVMQEQNNGYADGFIISALARATGNSDSLVAMVAEVASEAPFTTFRYNDFPDSIPGDNLYTANSQIARNDSMNFCTRYNNVKNAIGNGTNIGSAQNKSLLLNNSSWSNNIQFMQYIPEQDSFRISVYQKNVPAWQNPMAGFQISDLFDEPVGIHQKRAHDINISGYPNPCKDKLTIRGLKNLNGKVNISIYNLKGQEIQTETMNDPSGPYLLNVDDISPGVYIIQIQSAEQTKALKVVKQ